MNDALSIFFSWPSGGIWSNLLASLIWSLIIQVPVFLWGVHKLHKQRERHHAVQMAKLDAIHAQTISNGANK